MYPYGSEVGDTLLTFVNKCIRKDIPRGGLRFFERRHRKLFVRCTLFYVDLSVNRNRIQGATKVQISVYTLSAGESLPS